MELAGKSYPAAKYFASPKDKPKRTDYFAFRHFNFKKSFAWPGLKRIIVYLITNKKDWFEKHREEKKYRVNKNN